MPKELNLTRPTNNTELVASMMEFSRHGALAQMFIVNAIQQHADQVSKATPDQVGDAGGRGMLAISPESWIGVAQEIKAKMEAFYGRHEQSAGLDLDDDKPLKSPACSLDGGACESCQ